MKSRLGATYVRIYDTLCGQHPNLKPWHFQWLDSVYFISDLGEVLPTLRGTVLDVGCGNKPYKQLLSNASAHVGIDVTTGDDVDYVITASEPWPFEDSHFDNIVATQVMEHVADYEFVLGEVRRTLKPGGCAVFTFPFLYNEHGAPDDYQRFTVHKAKTLLADFEVESVRHQGGIGSTLTILILNWMDASLNLTFPGRIAKALLLPVSIPLHFLMNLTGWLVDRIDRTNEFYSNVMICFRSPQSTPPQSTDDQPTCDKP